MAAGDVTVKIFDMPFTSQQIKDWIDATQVTINDNWCMASVQNQVIIIHIEEA
jgi:hypothetical protein